ncbi:disrupted in schizophrenia 1 protein [Calypte anna]|uniref:disrupted in schizophrenia 1 protein n=1 Tax=Calypte anna TaxID=9244 RepID=UPI0011C40457|nr:disrupted in schizophrenia 1 protein [Calypte anna]
MGLGDTGLWQLQPRPGRPHRRHGGGRGRAQHICKDSINCSPEKMLSGRNVSLPTSNNLLAAAAALQGVNLVCLLNMSVLTACLQPQCIKGKILDLTASEASGKAIEEDDYDRADKFRQRLEDLEEEKNSLKFQLPSRHPSVSSFLDKFVTQVQAALRWAAEHRVRHEETQLWHENEHKLLRSTYQERMQVWATRRNQLLQEKKCLQQEIEDLRARLAGLEAKDEQLRKEIEEQDGLIQSQDCELAAVLGCISLRELQEISKALDDTLAFSYQIPFSLELPGTIKSLQEKDQSFSMSIKETTAKVCTNQKLCSTLRSRVSAIETQLPALLQAKMLAVSGSNFGTAKDLAEDIKSLTSEKEGLEGVLNELLILSARNIRKLERIKDDYSRLKEELEEGEAAFGPYEQYVG